MALVFRFIQRLYQAVGDDPLKSMNAIYEETRSEFTRPLDQVSHIGVIIGLLAQNAVKVVKFIKIVCYWGGHN
jgi:hypothetical protein